MKNFSLVVALLCALCACTRTARVEGTLRGVSEAGVEVALQRMEGSKFRTVDTLRTKKGGTFAFSLAVPSGDPAFVRLSRGGRQLASLLLAGGDRVRLALDTLGGLWEVEGSAECVALRQVDSVHRAFLQDMEQEGSVRCYVSYYRDRVRYVLSHAGSLSVIPVLFQQAVPGVPLFGQPTDGMLMRQVADSLSTVYPRSRAVAMLRSEAERRCKEMEMVSRIRGAQEVGYADMTLPGLEGIPIRLGASLGKVTMVYFWTPTPAQKRFNLDVLLPLYKAFHGRGLEIYAVALHPEKADWATTVRLQGLPWVNVCDTRGAQSPYVGIYGVTTTPMVWYLVGEDVDAKASADDLASMRAYLKAKLGAAATP